MSPVSASHSSNPNHKNTYRSVPTANGKIKTIHILTSQAQSIYCKLNMRGSATKREDRFLRVPLRIRSGTRSAAFTASVNTGRVKSAQARHEAAQQQGGGTHNSREPKHAHTYTRTFRHSAKKILVFHDLQGIVRVDGCNQTQGRFLYRLDEEANKFDPVLCDLSARTGEHGHDTL